MREAPISGAQPTERWDRAYETRGATGVSWFQPVATTSIQLIERLGIAQGAAVIDIGGGASLLVDALLDRGFTDLSVLDVSKAQPDTDRVVRLMAIPDPSEKRRATGREC